jgi:hypothetical protein
VISTDGGQDGAPRHIRFKADVEWEADSLAAKMFPSDQEKKDSTVLTLADVRSTYFEASKKVSEVLRQYALAGIALVWVFKGNGASTFGLDPKLLTASLWILGAISADFLQYVATSYIWYGYFRFKETKDKNLDQQFVAPEYMNWPNQTLFLLKVVALVIAYGFYILPYVWWRVHH